MNNFYASVGKKISYKYLQQVFALAVFLMFSNVINAQITGTVYRDYDSNGAKGSYEHGVANLSVTAEDADGNTAFAITDALGNYSLNITNCTGQVRVQFDLDGFNNANSIEGDDIFCSFAGSQSVTSVTFVNCNATNVDLGVNTPEDFCGSNPPVIVPCYVNGNPLGDCTGIADEDCAANSDVLVGFEYNASGDAEESDLSHMALANQMGAVWGLAYQKETQSLFASAVLRSHVGFGPAGIGGIYKVDINSGLDNPTISTFVDLNTVCGGDLSVGEDPHTDLPANKKAPAFDVDAIFNVAKIGIGGITMSSNQNSLYALNMGSKQLHKIEIIGDNVFCGNITSFDIPSPCTNNNDFRPWAVSTWHGRVFVGAVCSGENNSDEFKGVVYEFTEPDNWTAVLEWDFETANGSKGCTNQLFGCEWHTWTPDYPNTFGLSVIEPQPVVADIVFDGDGSMIIGLIDRTAMQAGYQNYLFAEDETLYSAFSGGDILRAQWSGSNWVMESNGQFAGVANAPVGCGVDNGQGNGGGEFYCGDDWESLTHKETSLGGLAILLGTGDVMSAAFDPTTSINGGGVQKFNNTDGSNILTGDDANSDDFAVYHNVDEGSLGKAAGIGDVQLICGQAPIEIGNRVWLDDNQNGIQDPGEMGVEGVVIGLYNPLNDELLTTTTTNANGEYAFNFNNVPGGIMPNTEYGLIVEAVNFEGAGNLFGLVSTTTNVGSNDLIDADNPADDEPCLKITTADYGQNNHSYDFGFVEVIDLELSKTADVAFAGNGEPIVYTITVTNNGPATATGVEVYDMLDATALSFVSSDGDYNATSGIWVVGTLAANETATLNISVTVTQEGTINNIAQVSSANETDVDSTPNNYEAAEDDQDDVTIIEPPFNCDDFVISNVETTPTDCGGNTGSLYVEVTGSEGPFTYAIDNGNPQPFSELSFTVNGIAAGQHEVVIFDITNNCTKFSAFTINATSAPVLTQTNLSHTTCGENNGSASISILGAGEMNITFNGESFTSGTSGTYDFIDLAAGNYTVEATDENNCSASFTFTINTSAAVSYDVSVTPTEGCDSSNGTMSIVVSGGSGNYTLMVEGITYETLEVGSLAEGTYDGILTDEDCGTFNFSFEITENCTQTNNPPCTNTVNLCTAEQTPLIFCLEDFGCDPDGDNIVITEAHSLYDCSITYLNDTCIQYLPLPAFVDLTDEVNVTVCDDGTPTECSIWTLYIYVGDCGGNPLASIGDYVWVDSNENGVQDIGENGLGNVTVTLTLPDGSTLTTQTDVTGHYIFENLEAGAYSVAVTIPDGYLSTTATSYNITLNEDEIYSTADFGVNIEPIIQLGSIGDYVWLDDNQNGIQDEGESGLSNATVILTLPNGSTMSMQTNTNGFYLFDELPAGSYTVQLVVNNSLIPTTPTEYAVNLSEGENYLDADFGLYAEPVIAEPCEDTLSYCLAPLTQLQICLPNCDDDGDPVTIVDKVSTYGCSTYLLNDTCISYLPLPGFLGNDYVYVTLCDNNIPNECYVVVLDIFVTSEGCDGPNAVNDETCISSGSNSVVIDVMANDYHPNGNLTFGLSAISDGVNGIVAMNVDGTITFTAGTGFYEQGGGSFTYTICDTQGICDEALVSITPCNDECIAEAGSFSPPAVIINENGFTNTPEVSGQQIADGYFYFYVLATNLSIEDTIEFDIVAINETGVFNLNQFIYENYTIHGFSFLGSLSDLPNYQTIEEILQDIASGDICGDIVVPGYQVSEECQEVIDICAEPAVQIQLCPEFCDLDDVTYIANAITTFNCSVHYEEGSLCVDYIALPGYSGLDSLFIIGCNDAGMCDTSFYYINVGSCIPPDAVNDVYSFEAGQDSYTIYPLQNDSDPCGRPLTASILTQPQSGGTVTDNGDGSFTFTPDAGFTGTVNFTYQACNDCADPECDNAVIQITIENPQTFVTANPDIVNVPMNEVSVIDVLSNDEGTNLTVTSYTQTENGTLVLNGDGTFTYTPNAGFEGEDGFTYVVCDPMGVCDSTAVSITVYNPEGPNQAPIANNDQAETDSNTPITIDVTANDSDPNGDDLIVTSATIIDAPQEDCGTVEIVDNQVVYTPMQDCIGEVVIEVVVCDGLPEDPETLCDTSLLVIAVGVPLSNDAPIAEDDFIFTNFEQQIDINVLANDFDPNGDILSVSIVTEPVNGAYVINPDNTITYTPDNDFEGEDFLIYVVCDDGVPPLCDSAVVYITVYPPALTGPTAQPDVITTPVNTIVVFNVLDNDEGAGLTVTLLGDTECGTLEEGTVEGEFIFTPNPDTTCVNNVLYQVCDVNGLCDTSLISITVFDLPNQAPNANNDQAETVVGDTILIDVLANDTDPENGELVITDVIQPDSCGVVNIVDNQLEFVSDDSCEPQEVVFQYIVCDMGTPQMCDTATVVVAVGIALSNNAPIAEDDNVVVPVNQSSTIDVLANDSDPDGDEFSVTAISSDPENGTVEIDPVTGNVIYTPNTDFFGIDYFTYVICDTGVPVLCDTAYVEIQVGNGGGIPLVQEDLASTPINTPVTIDVLANDGPNLTINSFTQPTNGTVELIDGMLVYTPNPDFVGQDYFEYTACDVFGNCATTIVAVNVFDSTENLPPVGGNDVYTYNCNTGGLLEMDVTANDVDPENGEVSVFAFSVPSSPCVTLTQDAVDSNILYFDLDCEDETCVDDCYAFIVIIEDNMGATDTTETVVCIEPLEPSNIAPVAVDDSLMVDCGQTINFNVLDNDFDVNTDDTLFTTIGSLPLNGELLLDVEGNATYTTNDNFEGTDYFTYILCDNGFPELCDTAYAVITINCNVNPECPEANPNYVQTPANTPISIDVLSNDLGDNIFISGSNEPANGGSLLFDDNTNEFVYFPSPDATSVGDSINTDYFEYFICNGDTSCCDTSFVVIQIFDLPNQPPVAGNDVAMAEIGDTIQIDVLVNDGDPENGDLTITDVNTDSECIDSLAIVDVNGVQMIEAYVSDDMACDSTFAEFTYIVCDDSLACDTATVVIAIGMDDVSNHPPVGVDDVYETDEDTPITFNVLDNDSDPDGDNITVSFITEPTFGEIMWDSNGEVTYTPNPDFFGTDYMAYVLCDDGYPVLCDTAYVTINVIESMMSDINIQPDVVITEFETPISIDVLSNDIGDGLTVTSFTLPQNGTLMLDTLAGIFTYVPNDGFEGEDFFFYTACDENNNCDSTIVSITVLPDGANYPPIAGTDIADNEDCEEICIDVLANDIDINGDTLIITNVTAPIFGTAIINLNDETGLAEICYTPDDGVSDTVDVFTYIVCDGFLPDAACDTAQVAVTLCGGEITNLPPVAVTDFVTVNSGVVDTICVLDNDFDPNGDSLIVTILAQPTNGTAVLLDDGCIEYTSNAGFEGTDAFPYMICDDGIPSLCDTAYVNIDVTGGVFVMAVDDYATTFVDQEIEINTAINDIPDSGYTSVTIVQGPFNGNASIDNNGLITYTPNNSFNGIDSLQYEICVGLVCDTAWVYIDIIGCDLLIENGISPNGDGINDEFDIPDLQDCYGDNDPELIIFNRWGNEIYRKKGFTGLPQDGWNGTWKGEDVPDGTYFYILLLNTGNKDDNISGFIEVLR